MRAYTTTMRMRTRNSVSLINAPRYIIEELCSFCRYYKRKFVVLRGFMKHRYAACIVILFLLGLTGLCALDTSVAAANRRTALRCFQSAKSSAANSAWADVVSYAEMGLAYDDEIPDLWYLYAVGCKQQNAPIYDVLPLIENALTGGKQWVDYNKDGARILYADILSDTGNAQRALDVLEEKPFLYSADAEFIRIKSFYRLKTPRGISSARERTDSCRKIYPDDTRFPLLFFSNEYSIQRQAGSEPSAANMDASTRALAQAFIKSVPGYRNGSARLSILAAVFAEGEEQERMLKAFGAHNLTDALYPRIAMRAGIMTEQEALIELSKFADDRIDMAVLEDFASALTEPAVKQLMAEYLTAYEGTIEFDRDSDLIPDVTVKYHRGRPETVWYDKNQDGHSEWVAECDFGTPVSVFITAEQLNLSYFTYPSVKTAVYGKNRNLVFNLVDDTLLWSPVDIAPSMPIAAALGTDFYVPEPVDVAMVDDDMLIAAASSYEIPSSERSGAMIKFTVLDGVVQNAIYSVNGEVYARTLFNNGAPDIRTVDSDGDGMFETTEQYAFDRGNVLKVHTFEEERKVMENLFGMAIDDGGFYVSMISVDRNGDTIPDFTEEYLPNGGKIASWDNDGDGKWEVRYVKYPAAGNNGVEEDSMFYTLPARFRTLYSVDGKTFYEDEALTKGVRLHSEEIAVQTDRMIGNARVYDSSWQDRITVACRNGVPVSVLSADNTQLSVSRDDRYGFYWVGRKLTSESAQNCIDALNKAGSQGVCIMVDRILAVRIGDLYFGTPIVSD